MPSKALYIHIPFCDHLCHYCDFPKLLSQPKYIELYLQSLLSEIASYKIKKHSLTSIYIGGGTPTSLSTSQLELLLKNIVGYLDHDYEFTVEANIENFDQDKGQLLLNYGVNRLSFGGQSFNNDVLNIAGRAHRGEEIIQKITLARELGFSNINLDLIYGLPLQNLEIYEKDLVTAIHLGVNHLSTYSLTVSPHTVFFNRHVKPLSEDDDAFFYHRTVELLKQHGYQHYEISNFALQGNQSRHNLTYWRNETYYGVGLGAHGYLNNVRYANTKNLQKYLAGKYRESEENVTLKDELEYEFMLRFRTSEGINHQQFYEKFKKRLNVDFQEVYNELYNQKLLIDDGINVRVSESGMAILDTIILKFLRKVK